MEASHHASHSAEVAPSPCTGRCGTLRCQPLVDIAPLPRKETSTTPFVYNLHASCNFVVVVERSRDIHTLHKTTAAGETGTACTTPSVSVTALSPGGGSGNAVSVSSRERGIRLLQVTLIVDISCFTRGDIHDDEHCFCEIPSITYK